MKICFLIYNISNSAGSERVTSLIANELAKRGNNIHILSICGTNKCHYELHDNIKVHTLFKKTNNINYKINYFRILAKIYAFYKKNNFDLSIDVFANMSLFSIPIKKKLKFKNITWEHFNFYSHNGKIKFSRKLSCKYSDALITLTSEDINAYKKNIKKINCYIDYIYNPTPFCNNDKSKLDNNIILTVGRLTYQKGYDMLLDAWDIVYKKNKKWKLLIVGTGEEEENLKNKCKKMNLKNISFEGRSSNIENYYKNSSLFVSTSRYEGLPMCMIEAQSYGLPIVSFNCKTGPSEIVDNNKNGFLIDNFDIEELASKILELINNRENLIGFSNNINIEKFMMNNIIKKWEYVIKSLDCEDINK